MIPKYIVEGIYSIPRHGFYSASVSILGIVPSLFTAVKLRALNSKATIFSKLATIQKLQRVHVL
jgi:hypothetical protein